MTNMYLAIPIILLVLLVSTGTIYAQNVDANGSLVTPPDVEPKDNTIGPVGEWAALQPDYDAAKPETD